MPPYARIFALSVRRHLSWWLRSFSSQHQAVAPLRPRRLVFLFLIYPLFLILQAVHWLGFLCDELFFADYRQVEPRDPVFISGIPRSGTTFLHRTLAADTRRFTSFTTWEALLAPSVTQRKLLRMVARIDRAFGAPVRRSADAILAKAAGDFDNVHKVGLTAPEEDYLALLPAGGCFIFLLAFPFSNSLSQLGRLDEAPEAERSARLAFYRSLVQRHLFYHGADRILLSKNAAFASWAGHLAQTFPGAKLIICVREPVEALSSQLSSLQAARQLFGTDPDGTWTETAFGKFWNHNYPLLAELTGEAAPAQIAVVEHRDMAKQPQSTIRSALSQLGIRASEPLGRAIDQLQPHPGSGHAHQLTERARKNAQIEGCAVSAYNTILRSACRARPIQT